MIKLILQYFLAYTILAPLLIACSYFPVSSRKYYIKAMTQKPFDVIIVPGVPYNGKKWSIGMKARVYWSVYLYRNGMTKNVIYSGGAVYSPYYEGIIMAKFAEVLGVSKENIYTETESEYSCENLVYSYNLAKKSGFIKIAVATDPFQTMKLRRFKRKFDLPVVFMPVVFFTLAKVPQYNPVIDPTDALMPNFIPVSKRYTLMEMMRKSTGRRLCDSIYISKE